MPAEVRWSITSPWAQGRLRAFEPTLSEVLAAAPLLAAFYNDSHNAAMMTHTQETGADEVVEVFHTMREAGDRPFLLEQDGELMGDGDFRNVQGAEAEFAIMVGPRVQQRIAPNSTTVACASTKTESEEAIAVPALPCALRFTRGRGAGRPARGVAGEPCPGSQRRPGPGFRCSSWFSVGV